MDRAEAIIMLISRSLLLGRGEWSPQLRFTKSADNSEQTCFPYCAWICLDSWVSFDLPLA